MRTIVLVTVTFLSFLLPGCMSGSAVDPGRHCAAMCEAWGEPTCRLDPGSVERCTNECLDNSNPDVCPVEYDALVECQSHGCLEDIRSCDARRTEWTTCLQRYLDEREAL